jgi:hypothetical protein
MSRLIDADLLKENISRWLKPSAPDETEMIEVADALVSTMIEIEEQPTAFDVDKVVETLMNRFRVVSNDEDLEWNRAIVYAVKIVKGGGVE